MAIPFHKRINSIETVINSIRYDPQVFRWFVKFVDHPVIRGRLKDSPEDQARYRRLARITACQTIAFIVAAIVTGDAFLTKQPLLLTLLIPVALLWHALAARQRDTVAGISTTIITRDREMLNLEAKTLFQICEHYGKALSTASLVSVIARQDSILRKTVIYACVLTCLIYPIDFWNDWIILFAFLLVRGFINTPLVFDRL